MSLVICPIDCNSEVPIVDFSLCAPETNNGQVEIVYLTNIGYPLSDWNNLSEWNSRLSNTSTAPDAIRTLNVIGDKPLPESQIKIISRNRRVVGNSVHTLNLRIDETNQINHDFIRGLQCGGNYLIWYQDSNGNLFGGQVGSDGIVAFINLGMVIPESRDELEVYQGTAIWDAKFTEDRTDSPMA